MASPRKDSMEVTLALIGQEIRTYIEEDKTWKKDLGDRLVILENRILDVEMRTSASVQERIGLRRDIDGLSIRVTAWDLINSIGGAILAIVMVRKT